MTALYSGNTSNSTAAWPTGVAQGCNTIMLNGTTGILETLNDTIICNYSNSALVAHYCIILSASAEHVYTCSHTEPY